jgi:hypothetical protein
MTLRLLFISILISSSVALCVADGPLAEAGTALPQVLATDTGPNHTQLKLVAKPGSRGTVCLSIEESQTLRPIHPHVLVRDCSSKAIFMSFSDRSTYTEVVPTTIGSTESFGRRAYSVFAGMAPVGTTQALFNPLNAPDEHVDVAEDGWYIATIPTQLWIGDIEVTYVARSDSILGHAYGGP